MREEETKLMVLEDFFPPLTPLSHTPLNIPPDSPLMPLEPLTPMFFSSDYSIELGVSLPTTDPQSREPATENVFKRPQQKKQKSSQISQAGTRQTNKNHTGKFKCDFPECNKSFAKKFVLNRHKKIHTGIKPFGCDFPMCEQKFIQNSDLKRHQDSHKQGTRLSNRASSKRKISQTILPPSNPIQPESPLISLEPLTPVFFPPGFSIDLGASLPTTQPQNQGPATDISVQKKRKSSQSESITSLTTDEIFDVEIPQLPEIYLQSTQHQVDEPLVPKAPLNPIPETPTVYPAITVASSSAEIKVQTLSGKPINQMSVANINQFSQTAYKKIARPQNNEFRCDSPNCNKTFTRKQNFKHHKDRHEKKFCCGFQGCNLTFKRKDHLKGHINAAHLKKKFSCNFPKCREKYTSKQNLNRHQKKSHKNFNSFTVHTSETPINELKITNPIQSPPTPTETAPLIQPPTATQHQEDGTHMSEAPLNPSPDTPMSDANLNQFSQMADTKTDPGPNNKFRCDSPNCNKIFTRNYSLIRHKDRREKKFCCGFQGCNKTFSRKEFLDYHKLSAHLRRYRCDFPKCKKKFTSKVSIISHQEKSHQGFNSFTVYTLKKPINELEITCPIQSPSTSTETALLVEMTASEKNEDQSHTIISVPQLAESSLRNSPPVQTSLGNLTPIDVHIPSEAKINQVEAPDCQAPLTMSTELVHASSHSEFQISSIIEAVRNIISMIFLTPSLSPELQKFQISFATQAIQNTLSAMMPIPSVQHKSQISLTIEDVRNRMTKIIATRPLNPEQQRLHILSITEVVRKFLATMLTGTPSALLTENPAPSQSLDRQFTPALSHNPYSLFGLAQPFQAGASELPTQAVTTEAELH